MKKLRFLLLGLAAALLWPTPSAATDHFVSPTGGNIAPFISWENAATNIQDAIDAAVAGEVVWVTNGLYATGGKVMAGDLTNRIALDKPLTVQSVNGPLVTTVLGAWDPVSTNGPLAVRCAWLTNGALLSGFTLQGGGSRNSGDTLSLQTGGAVWATSTNALAFGCIIRANSATWYGGGAYGAGLAHCTLSGNSVMAGFSHASGGGAFACNMTNCAITGNFSSGSAGGAALGSSGVLVNCSLTRNVSVGNGGGFYGDTANRSTLINCTVALNSAGGRGFSAYGGGVCYATLTNCVVYANACLRQAGATDSNYFSGTFSFGCTAPLPAGAGNISADPQLLTDGVHLGASSPCIGGGLGIASGTDIDGQPWATPPAIGCDEWLPSPIVVAAPQPVLSGFPPDLNLWAQAAGQDPFVYFWLKDGASLEDGAKYANSHSTNLTVNAFGPGDAGAYQLVASNAFGVSASAPAMVSVHCADAACPAPAPPYTDWSTAATNLQDAIDAAGPGDFILVTNGVYATGGKVMAGDLTNRVVLDKALTVQSVNGASVTTIQGAWDPATRTGPLAVRCAWLTNGAVLSGFTLQGGATRNAGDIPSLQSGGGVWASSTNALVSGCIIRNNSATIFGGGAYRAGLLHCSLSGNSVTALFTFTCGGGAYGCNLTNCAITANYSSNTGGGAGSLNGGAGILINCSLIGNKSAGSGAGFYGDVTRGTLVNCTVALNSAVIPVPNSAQGGGVYNANLTNCIVYANSISGFYTPSSSNYYSSTFSSCCTAPLPAGAGNISADPQLLTDSVHLGAGSPCIGAGLVIATGTDIDGQPWATPPAIGCDEWSPSPIVIAPPQSTLTGFPPVLNLWAQAAGQEPFAYSWLKDGAVLQDGPKYSSTHTTNLAVYAFGPGDAGAYQLVVSNSFGVSTGATALIVVHCANVASPAPASPYSDWSTAATSIQDAVDAAGSGEFVLVTNGLYATGGRIMAGDLVNRVAVNSPVEVTSMNGANSTILQGAFDPVSTNGPLAVRCAWLAQGASLRGFTLLGGATRTNGDSFLLESGGGAWCSSTNELLASCILSNNRAAYGGGGCYQGQLDHCIVCGSAATWGGGAYAAFLSTSLVLSNVASLSGGGLYNSTFLRCTVAGNLAQPFSGGGEYGSTGWGSIIYNNIAPTFAGGSNDWDSQSRTHLYSCWTPTSSDPSLNTTPNPQLALDGFHLTAISPCRGAGNPLYPSATDLDGEPWLNPPSVGCDEYYAADFTGPLQPGPIMARTGFSSGPPLRNYPAGVYTTLSGKADRISWSYGDGTLITNDFKVGRIHTWTNVGDFNVIFTAYNADYPDGVSTNLLVHVYQPDPPQLTAQALTGTNFSFTFTTQLGVYYLIQQTTNLTPPVAWTTIGLLQALSNPRRFTDVNATNSTSFYRVLAQ